MAWSTGIHQTNPFRLSAPAHLRTHPRTPQPRVGQDRTLTENGLTGWPMERVSLQKIDLLLELSGIFAISADSIQENLLANLTLRQF